MTDPVSERSMGSSGDDARARSAVGPFRDLLQAVVRATDAADLAHGVADRQPDVHRLGPVARDALAYAYLRPEAPGDRIVAIAEWGYQYSGPLGSHTPSDDFGLVRDTRRFLVGELALIASDAKRPVPNRTAASVGVAALHAILADEDPEFTMDAENSIRLVSASPNLDPRMTKLLRKMMVGRLDGQLLFSELMDLLLEVEEQSPGVSHEATSGDDLYRTGKIVRVKDTARRLGFPSPEALTNRRKRAEANGLSDPLYPLVVAYVRGRGYFEGAVSTLERLLETETAKEKTRIERDAGGLRQRPPARAATDEEGFRRLVHRRLDSSNET